MRKTIPLIAAILSICVTSASSQTVGRYPKPPAPVAINGSAELSSLSIKWQRTGDAKQDAETSTIEVQLYIGGFSPEELVHTKLRITDLAPLEDDTGKVLSTQKRLEAIPALKDSVPVKVQHRSASTAGAIALLAFDAPARPATKLKLLEGKAVLTHSRMHHLRFTKEAAVELNGKQLEHPKLGELKIVPTLTVKDDISTLTLTVPGDFKKIVSFGLLNESQKAEGFRIISSGSRRQGAISERFQSYRGDQTGKTYLVVNLAEEDEPQAVSFEFKDIELP